MMKIRKAAVLGAAARALDRMAWYADHRRQGAAK